MSICVQLTPLHKEKKLYHVNNRTFLFKNFIYIFVLYMSYYWMRNYFWIVHFLYYLQVHLISNSFDIIQPTSLSLLGFFYVITLSCLHHLKGHVLMEVIDVVHQSSQVYRFDIFFNKKIIELCSLVCSL